MPVQGGRCFRCARRATGMPFAGEFPFDEPAENPDGEVAVDFLENIRKRNAPAKNKYAKCGFLLSLAGLLATFCFYAAVAIFILNLIEQLNGVEYVDETSYREFIKSLLIVAFVCAVAITALAVSGLACCVKGLSEYGEWEIGKKSERAGIVFSVFTLLQISLVFVGLCYFLFFAPQ